MILILIVRGFNLVYFPALSETCPYGSNLDQGLNLVCFPALTEACPYGSNLDQSGRISRLRCNIGVPPVKVGGLLFLDVQIRLTLIRTMACQTTRRNCMTWRRELGASVTGAACLFHPSLQSQPVFRCIVHVMQIGIVQPGSVQSKHTVRCLLWLLVLPMLYATDE